MQHVFLWWLILQILGWAVLPLAYRLFKWLPGRGYAFAKPLGLLLVSYILWLGASLGFLRNTVGGILVAIALAAGVSFWFYRHRRDETDPLLLTFLREQKGLILTVEILFIVAFCAWSGLRAYAPDKIMSAGGEKFMEIAFLNGILRSTRFPPLDPWLSGFAISYYYFGYVMMALLTRLSGVAPGIGFDLYDALLFALTVTGAFGVVYNLVAGSQRGKAEPSDERQPLWYGMLGALFVAVMGNLEGFLEALYARGILPGTFWDWIDVPDLVERGQMTGSWYPGHGWWWWRASRVLRDRDFLSRPILSPIDEFPFFSFLLGDNHPHVLALPFVLLAIALALNLLRRQRAVNVEQSRTPWWNPVAVCLDGDWALFIAYGLALGGIVFLNTWDYPIYLGLAVLAYGIGCYTAREEPLGELLQRMVVLGAGFLLAGLLVYLPFFVGFRSQAGGVLPYLLPPTRLPQYLVMFGPFVFVIAWFLVAQLSRGTTQALLRPVAQGWGLVMLAPVVLLVLVLSLALFTEYGRQFVQGVMANPDVQQVVGDIGPAAAAKAILLARLNDPWLFLILTFLVSTAAVGVLRRERATTYRPSASDLFASLLILTGLALALSVEFVYLRDNFGVRMNTIFKFYFQAWVMLGCASAYGVWWVLNRGGWTRHVFLVGAAILTVAGMVYSLMASYSRVQGFQHEPNLNGASNIARNNPDDWAAIEWLRANAQGTPGTQGVPVILEAPGDSYDYEGRISAFTGFPAVLGWSLHEGQWRGDYTEQHEREPDIAMIYTTHDGEQALQLLHKWNVDYVVVGATERRYVEKLCEAPDRSCFPTEALRKFDRLLEPVFEQGQTTIYRVPDYGG